MVLLSLIITVLAFLGSLVGGRDLSSLPQAVVSPPPHGDTLPASPEPAGEEPVDELIYELNFGRGNTEQQDIKGSVVYFRDLESWGRSRGLILLPDLPFRNLQDFEAQLIPPYGLSFSLSAPGRSDVFLYLDLAVYRPREQKDAVAVRKIVWLEVLVNGNQVGLAYQGGSSFSSSPLRFKIPREHIPSRKMKVKLLPSPGNPYFAIWDSFVSPFADIGERAK